MKTIKLRIDPLIMGALDDMAKARGMNRVELIRACLYTAVWRERNTRDDLKEATYYPAGKGAIVVPGYRLRRLATGTYKAVKVDDDGLMIKGIDTDANL